MVRLINDELEKLWKQAVEINFKPLLRHLVTKTEEKHEKHVRIIEKTWARFDAGDFRIRVRGVTACDNWLSSLFLRVKST